MKKILIPVLSIMGFAPVIAFATDTTAGDIMFTIGNLLGYVTPVLVTIAVIYFIYTVIVYTMSGDDKKKADAKKNIIPALIGLFLIVSFWGILSVVSNTFNVGPEQLREEHIPCVPNPAMGITC